MPGFHQIPTCVETFYLLSLQSYFRNICHDIYLFFSQRAWTFIIFWLLVAFWCCKFWRFVFCVTSKENIYIGSKHSVSFRVGTPPPLFWENPLFLMQILEITPPLPPSFREPSKLVHANCMENFKMKELHSLLY